MQIRRPPTFEQRGIAAKANRRRVVDQRVEPDVDDARRIPRQRDAPRLARPAHRNVLQTALDQAKNLVAADVRLEKLGMRGEVVEQRLLILREPEEIVLLANPFGLQRRVQRTVAVDEILLLLELLAADAVPPLVDALENVAGVPQTPRQFRDTGFVTRLGGADEIVERHVQTRPRVPELLLHLVAVGQRVEPGFHRLLEHVLGMLVIPHQEARVDAAEPLVARDDVGADLFVGRSKMGPAVDVVDRGREKEAAHSVRAP